MWLFLLQPKGCAITQSLFIWPVQRKQRVRQRRRRQQAQQVLQKRQQPEPKRGPEQQPVRVLVPEQMLLGVVGGGEAQYQQEAFDRRQPRQ